MTTGEWISLASSCGALGAALVSLFTLFELFRQRKSTYKPDLCVLKKGFYIRRLPFAADLPVALDWVHRNLEHCDMTTEPSVHTGYAAGVPIVNVGFGAAKSVKAKWNFDASEVLAEVNRLAQETFQSYYLAEDDNYLSIKSGGKSVYNANNEMNTWEFEYLLPVSTEAGGREILFPPSYVLLVSAYLSLCAKAKCSISVMKVPSIELDLSYNDIGKGQHNSTHKLRCNISAVMLPSETDTTKPPEFWVEYYEGS